MNFFAHVLCMMIACGGQILADWDRVELFSVSLSFHTQALYQELRNEDPPSDSDPAFSRATVRRRICENIASSKFFRSLRWLPLSPQVIQHFKDLPEYSPIFERMFVEKSILDSSKSYYYVNEYQPLEFQTRHPIGHYREFVFACPLEDIDDRTILTFYVSKEYNVGPFGHELHLPGRFIFGTHMKNFPLNPFNVSYVMLAEQPARVHKTDPNFNIEVHYLRMRKYIRPADSNSIDPLCKLTSEDVQNPRNKYRRLCVAVASSSDFFSKIRQLKPTFNVCRRMEISFHTAEGMRMAAGRSYSEGMLTCKLVPIRSVASANNVLHISRAYLSNAVFVYDLEADGKIYLKNMSTNIAVLDELNSFDFPED